MRTATTAVDAVRDGRLYIGGEWREGHGGSLRAIDPSDETVLTEFAAGTEADVDDAVDAAHQAARPWRERPPLQRAGRVNALADVIEQHERELAELDATDSGNPVAAMLEDVRGACRELRLFAGLATEIKADAVGNGPDQFAYGRREPYGVVGRIVPFNHPFKFAVGKTAAALVAGNTVVLKPSEHTSLSAIRLAQLTEGVLPAGVINLVTGLGTTAGAALAAHPGVPRVAFTGGVEGGRAVLRAGAEHIKHVTLELGGKNPMIVFPDVDVDRAVQAAVSGMNLARSMGQSCMSTSRVFVHRDIADAFTDRLLAAVGSLGVGHPLDPTSDMGPLAYRAHYDRVMGYIRRGSEEGATLLTGGGSAHERGLYVDPTVFTDVDNDMTIAREEIFGPVMSLIRWSDHDAVVAAANDTPFGLTANIWTNDLRMAHLTAHRIDAGYVWINGNGKRVPGTPFGGYKQSGLGKESSLEEILEYCRHKVVAVGLQP